MLSGPVLRDTARLSQRYPPIARYGVFGVSTWPIGCDTPSPFSYVSPLESMRSGGARLPLKGGISAILARYPMKTRQMGAILPSAMLSRKGIARYGGVSRTGPLRQCAFNPVDQAVSNRRFANTRFSQLNDARCWHVSERSPAQCRNPPVGKALYFVRKSSKRAVTSGWRALTDVPTSLAIQLRKPLSKPLVRHSLN